VNQDPGILFSVGQSYWLGLPLILTGNLHMVMVKHDWFSGLKIPLDGGRVFRGRRLIGDHKTWRGVFVMTVFTGLFGTLVGLVGGAWAQRTNVAPLRYDQIIGGSTALSLALGYAIVNVVLGMAYALGELPNSMIKRRFNVEPGKTATGVKGALFLLMDQADSALAVLLAAVLVFGLSWQTFAVGLASLTLLHFAFNAGLYTARIRRNL